MKYLLTTFLLLSIMTMSYSQWSLKAAVGINTTDASQNPETHEVKAKVGWQVGASVVWGRKIYLEPGFFYHQQSLEFISDVDPELDLEHKLSAIRVPVAIGFNVLGERNSNLNVRVFGGGSGLFITKVDGDLDKDNITNPQWGVFAGAGIDFWILFLDLKYQWSLSDITSVTQFDIGKSRSFFTNVGFKWNF